MRSLDCDRLVIGAGAGGVRATRYGAAVEETPGQSAVLRADEVRSKDHLVEAGARFKSPQSCIPA